MSAVNWTSGKGGKILTLVFFCPYPIPPISHLKLWSAKKYGFTRTPEQVVGESG